MSTFDGVMTGFLVGAFMVAGVWAFVENDQQPTACRSADVPRRAEITATLPDGHRPGALVAQRVPVAARRGRRPVATDAPRVTTIVPTRARILERADPVAPRGVVGERRRAEPPPEIVRRADRRGNRVVVAVGGGVETPLSSTAGGAAQWDVRLHVQPYDHLGLELGYVGTSSARLETSSVEALATWSSRSGPGLEPYLLTGVGWRRFHSPLNVDVATLPVGVGLAYTRGPWRADTRLTLRLASRRGRHGLGATAHIGLAF